MSIIVISNSDINRDEKSAIKKGYLFKKNIELEISQPNPP